MARVELPWGAWYGDGVHTLEFPDSWRLETHTPQFPRPLSSDEIDAVLENPIDSPKLEELVRGKRSACIVVDDLARPTQAAEILPGILSRIQSGGVPESGVRLIVATGSHGTLSLEQIEKKIGAEFSRRFSVESHDCRGDLVGTGIPYGDQELRVNRRFMESEFRIVLGSVLPHSFAGNSGGAKMFLPGLTDVVATARSHKFVQLGLRGGTDPNENKFRLEIESLARKVGLNFTVCAVSDLHRRTVGLTAGDLVSAHRRACHFAKECFRCPVETTYDAVLINAFPKDIDLLQAEGAFVLMKSLKVPLVRERGCYVLCTATSEGLGHHGLFEPGGMSYRPPRKLKHLGESELIIYAPGVSRAQIHQVFWEGYPTAHRAEELRSMLESRLPAGSKIGLFPCGPMQQIEDRRT